MRKWYKITVYNKPSRIHNEIQQNYPGGISVSEGLLNHHPTNFKNGSLEPR